MFVWYGFLDANYVDFYFLFYVRAVNILLFPIKKVKLHAVLILTS